MNKIYVVAGNKEQFNTFVRKKTYEMHQADISEITYSHFVYVSSINQLRGLSQVHGYFVGTYRERSDLQEILDYIRIINNIPSSEYILPPLLLPQRGERRIVNNRTEIYDGKQWITMVP